MPKREQIDLLSLPVLMAAEMAWRQVQEFIAQMPGPSGPGRTGDASSRPNLASVEELLKGG